MTRDIHITDIRQGGDGDERQRIRTINANFRQIRDAILRLAQTNGLIDESLIDHGSIGGLGDDDHPLYPLVSGLRGFTGVVDGVYPTLDDHLATKKYVDDNIGGGGGNPSWVSVGSIGWVWVGGFPLEIA